MADRWWVRGRKVFLDAVDAVVVTALERIGKDPKARFGFFRRLLVVADQTVTGRSSWVIPSIRLARGLAPAGAAAAVGPHRTIDT